MLVFGDNRRNDTISFLVNDTDIGMMRWYEGIKIFYILSGKAQIYVEKSNHILEPEDFLVINSFEPHDIFLPEGGDILEMRIPLTIVSRVFGSAGHNLFDCDSARCLPEQKPHLAAIRRIYADLFRAIYKGRQDHSAYIFSEVYSLIDLLSRHFPHHQNADNPQIRRKNAEQLQSILSYINEHFRSDLSIHMVAQANFITSNYLSRYFQRMLGTTFTNYLASIRLGSAYGELISTEKTITQIALDNGFRSTNAFIKYFKERYGDTPGKLRRDLENQAATPSRAADDASIFQALLRHVSREEESDSPKAISCGIEVNVSRRGKPLHHQWKNLINLGYAKEGLQAAVQAQLHRIQQEIGFRYIRFHGLLDDDMLVYSEDAQGNPLLDFTLVDLLFDFLLSIGLKPYVEFGFVPSLLAHPQTRVFRRGSYLCLPTNLDKWMALVSGLVEHWEDRYGREELEHWYFTPMSINCILSERPTSEQDYADFFSLYHRVYSLLKAHSPRYQISGPGVYSNSIEKPFLWNFLQSCVQNSCLPDQFTCLCFPYDPIDDKDYFHTISSFDLPYPDALSPDEQYVTHLIDTLHQKFSAFGYDFPSLALIEWNSTMWQRDLCNDSCFKSAWLAKNITQNIDRIWGMGYWTANEMLEETASGSLDFHGGYGLFTCKGIPKSAYLSLELLNRLGDCLLYSSDSCVVTSRGNAVQVLLYHYCHYDELYRNNYLLDPNPTHCYDRFVEKGNLRILLDLYGLSEGTYRIRRYRLGREYGSAFDRWIAMGIPEHLNPEENSYLAASAHPDYHVSRVQVKQTLTLTSELAPHDVQLILIDPI